jgi:hypothetical protein
MNRRHQLPVRALGSVLALAGLALVVAACGEAPDATAQGAPAGQTPPPSASADTFQLVFEREVFNYPSFQRRNPFAPLTGDESGPRFEEVELQMVILFQDGPGSIATLAARGGTAQQRAAARTWRVREGDVIGNMRIVAIRLREVVIEVDEFGQRETRVLELRRSMPEADTDDDPPPTPPPPPPPDTIPPDTTLALATASISGTWNGGSE